MKTYVYMKTYANADSTIIHYSPELEITYTSIKMAKRINTAGIRLVE